MIDKQRETAKLTHDSETKRGREQGTQAIGRNYKMGLSSLAYYSLSRTGLWPCHSSVQFLYLAVSVVFYVLRVSKIPLLSNRRSTKGISAY